MDQPVYIIFAGVDGVGKSTFYHTDYWLTTGIARSMQRVNPDEILVASGGLSLSISDQLKAAKEAYRQIESNFEKLVSFNQETTLTGKTAVRNIRRAYSLGYKVVLYYIGVDSPEISVKRIEHRVEVGGHDIDSKTVYKRYFESLRNLSNVIDYCEEVIVFDNTERFTAVARWSKGVLSWVGKIFDHAPWLVDAMHDDLWRN